MFIWILWGYYVFFSLCYHFVNLNFICNNNMYIHLYFHFTYNTDKEIIDFEATNFNRCDIEGVEIFKVWNAGKIWGKISGSRLTWFYNFSSIYIYKKFLKKILFFAMREKSNQFKRTNQWPRGMNRTLLLLDEFSKLPPLGGGGGGRGGDGGCRAQKWFNLYIVHTNK